MKKSFSIDSSLSMVSHHAAVRTHPDRPAEHSGHGMGLTGFKTLHEDRGASPPALSPRSPPPPSLQPLTPDQPAHSGGCGAGVLRLLAALAAVAALSAALHMVDWPLQGMLSHGSSGDAVDSGEIGAGCAHIDALEAFDMSRFAGDWHTIAWLHSSAEASAWEQVVSNKCSTATFAKRPAAGRWPRQQQGGTPAGSSSHTAGSSGGKAAVAGADFEVRFTHRMQPQRGLGWSTHSGQQGSASAPSIVLGRGVVPSRQEPARLQVRLDSGHVLPYHVVATDYASWALMCTTSASLGGQQPAEVLALLSRTWAHDRLDVGDRLNELAARDLPWKEAVFAPAAACAAAAATA